LAERTQTTRGRVTRTRCVTGQSRGLRISEELNGADLGFEASRILAEQSQIKLSPSPLILTFDFETE
jgi:hypothetical protein